MECKDCRYYKVSDVIQGDKSFTMNSCEIAHVLNTKSCTYIASDVEVEDMDICYNCKYWLGGGDWGLSCQKNYLNCSANGFDEACEQFERRVNYEKD